MNGIGSINSAPGSCDSRRKLAIEVCDSRIAARIHNVVHRDWKNSSHIDLTDKELLADLENVDENVAMDLALSSYRKRREG